MTRESVREDLPLDEGSCSEVQATVGQLVFVSANVEDRTSAVAMVSFPGRLDIELAIPHETGTVAARTTSLGIPAEAAAFATRYWLHDRQVAVRSGATADAFAARTWAESERAAPPMRQVLQVAWLVARLAGDDELAGSIRTRTQAVCDQLEPDAPAWALDPEAVLLAHRSGFLSTSRLERVFETHPDAGVRGAAAYGLADAAFARTDPDYVRELLAALGDNETPLAAAARTFDPDGNVVEGGPLPPLEYRDRGDVTRTVTTPLQRPLLIYLWASWCPGCREELDRLRALHEALTPGTFELLTIALDENPGDAERVLREHEPLPGTQGFVAPDAVPKLRKAFEVWAASKLLLVDGEGTILLEDPDADELRSRLESLAPDVGR